MSFNPYAGQPTHPYEQPEHDSAADYNPVAQSDIERAWRTPGGIRSIARTFSDIERAELPDVNKDYRSIYERYPALTGPPS